MSVYLLHFSEPYHHARHYLGYAGDVERRVQEHEAGRGANLVRVIQQAGLTFALVRVWEGDRKVEKKLKNYHKSGQLCPVCRASRPTPGRTLSKGGKS